TKTNPTGAGLSQGGALWVSDGTIAMAHDTIGATTGGTPTGDVAQLGRSIYYTAGDGTFTTRASIFAEGASAECAGPNVPTSTGYHAEQGPTNVGLFSQPPDVGAEPLLAAVADNASTV